MLAYTVQGDGDANRPLVIVHGLFGSGRNWGVIAKRLSDERPVVTVDMRNHAGSFWADSHDYPAMADDLTEVIGKLGGKADVLGHSMGGKAAMVLALTRPDLVGRLIVADVAPIPYTHTQMSNLDAMASVDLSKVETRRDADNQLKDSVPDFVTRSFLLQSLDVKEKRWRLNIDVLRRDMDKVIGFPDLDAHFDGPTMFLSGGNSHYVKREYRARMKELFPHAVYVKIPGAGHWLHAEKPREFEAAARTFLNRS